MLENALFLFIAYLAAAAATLAGFGSSSLLVPVAVQFMDIRTAVVVVAFFHLFNNLFKVRFFSKKIDLKLALLFGIPSILMSFAGAMLISRLPFEIIKKILGVFLILFGTYSFFKPKLGFKKTDVTAVAGGTLSGFMAGLIGLGGSIRGAFLVIFGLPKEVYVATSAAIALVIDLTRVPTYLATRVADLDSYIQIILGLIGCAYLGVRTGKSLLGRIDQETFRRIVAVALVLIGIKILF